MSFSRGQQPELRQYLAWAWLDHCKAEHLDANDRCKTSKRCGNCAYCAWYEDTLFEATGRRSTTECNAGRDYDLFMRDLEIIHGRSVKWGLRAYKGDANRILHELRAAVGENDIDEGYLRAVAKRRLSLDYAPELSQLRREDLILILGEVKRYVRRKLNRSEDPF